MAPVGEFLCGAKIENCIAKNGGATRIARGGGVPERWDLRARERWRADAIESSSLRTAPRAAKGRSQKGVRARTRHSKLNDRTRHRRRRPSHRDGRRSAYLKISTLIAINARASITLQSLHVHAMVTLHDPPTDLFNVSSSLWHSP